MPDVFTKKDPNLYAPRPKISDVREFWKPYAELETKTPLTRFSKAQTAWLNGEINADDLWVVIKSLLGTK